ncbi:MAG: hypothetical protein EBZ49_12205 [Proteobacteria bacterium]|nr:hypothetical protein [Pseudomonadota bacterium]
MEDDIELLRLRARAKAKRDAEQSLESPVEQKPSDLNLVEKGLVAAEPILTPVGKILDVATGGAPIRAGVAKILEAQTGKEVAPEKKLLAGEAPGFAEMWESQGVPSGPSLSEMVPGAFSETGAGLPLKKGGMFDVTPRGIAGGLVDIATGSLAAPLVAAAKGTQAVGKLSKMLPSMPSKYSIMGTLSGVPSEAIETYAKNKSVINALDPAAAEELAQSAAEQAKTAVAATRKSAGEALSQVIQQAGGKKVSIVDFKKQLEKAITPPKEALKNKAAQETFAEMRAKIDQLLTRTEKVGGQLEIGPDGVLRTAEEKVLQVPIGDELTAQQLFDLKQQLKEMGDLYGGRSGLLSSLAKQDAPLVSKQFTANLTDATKKVDELIDQATAGASKEARTKYAELSKAADAADRYFSTPEKTLSTLSNLSSSAKAPARRILGEADKLYGTNLQESGKIIEAAKYFNEPSIEALSLKGSTSTSRTLGGSALGSYVGFLLGGPSGAAIGATVGSKAFSPFAVKNVYLPATEAASAVTPSFKTVMEAQKVLPPQMWLKLLEQTKQGEQK